MTGVGYAVYTTLTNSTCVGASASTTSRLVFQLSKNNGTTFYNKVYIGPTACPGGSGFLNAIEPGFASNSAGQVFGVFIEESSGATLPEQYISRAGDALGFVESLTTGGASFSSVSTLNSTGNLAMPVIAVHGQSISDCGPENIANSSTAISGGVLPISLNYIWSSNAGTTWSIAKVLPGLNSAMGYNAMSPSITVSPSGTVAVAYATNRACVAWSGVPVEHVPALRVEHRGGHVDDERDELGRTEDGANLNAPYATLPALTLGNYVGETTCQVGACLPGYFQGTPTTAISYNSAGTKLFVAWSGTVNSSVQPNSKLWWRWTGLGVSGTADGGTTWAGGYFVGHGLGDRRRRREPGRTTTSPAIAAGSGSVREPAVSDVHDGQ